MVTLRHAISIDAPIEVVFDAERNIDWHVRTQSRYRESAVGGVTSGLIELGQEVEWQARHLGVTQRLRSRITKMERPTFFRDEMVRGAFKFLRHDHIFRSLGSSRTEKVDVLEFAAPLGFLGRFAEQLFLERYMRRLIENKNATLKDLLEAKSSKSASPELS